MNTFNQLKYTKFIENVVGDLIEIDGVDINAMSMD
jgi:hypothetical protein